MQHPTRKASVSETSGKLGKRQTLRVLLAQAPIKPTLNTFCFSGSAQQHRGRGEDVQPPPQKDGGGVCELYGQP